MPAGSESLQGPRLEFVVRPVPGTVKRMKFDPPPNKDDIKGNPKLKGQTANEPRTVTEPAGYMVYMPSGACYRLTNKELRRRGFDRQPNILGIDQANSADTAVGRFKLAFRQEDRERAYKEMEEEVIKNCVGKIGNNLGAIISDYDPAGKMKEAA